MEQNTKFFVMVDAYEEGSYDLFVCHKDTPIPTAKEIVKRNSLHPCCEEFEVKEITMAEFLTLHNELLASLADSANDMAEWSPNYGRIHSWEFWEEESEED
jgi:hypothetical protein